MVTRLLRLADGAPAGRRRRRAGAGDLPGVARAARRPGSMRRVCGGRPAMIASVRGTVAALGPDGAVVEVGGVGLAVSCSPGHAGPAAGRRDGPAGDQPGRARGLADAVRLRRRRRAGAVRAAADRERGRARSWPRRSSPCTRRARCAAAIATSDLAALTQVPGIGSKGAERIVLELRDRIGSIDGSDSHRCAAGGGGRPRWRRGATSCAHALAGLGFSGKEAGRGDRRRRRRHRPTATPRRVRRCCAAASSCSAATR